VVAAAAASCSYTFLFLFCGDENGGVFLCGEVGGKYLYREEKESGDRGARIGIV
jgi:hypothetical protein